MTMHNSNCYVFDRKARAAGLASVLEHDYTARTTHELFRTRLVEPVPMGNLYEALLETIIIEMARESLSLRQALRKDGGPSDFPLPPTFKESDMGTLDDFPEPHYDTPNSTAEAVAELFRPVDEAMGVDPAAEPPQDDQPSIQLLVPAAKAPALAAVLRNGLMNTPGLSPQDFEEIQGVLAHIDKLAYLVLHGTPK